jgi:hypothetical protein
VRRKAVRAAPFHDWIGEAMLQENIAFGRRLEALAGLDGNHWLAVGMSIEPACGDCAVDEVFIDAVDLHSVDIGQRTSGFHDLVALADQFGALPVTRIRLTGISLRDAGTIDSRSRVPLILRAHGRRRHRSAVSKR